MSRPYNNVGHDLLSTLNTKPPAGENWTVLQLVEDTGRPDCTVYQWLMRLNALELVDRVKGQGIGRPGLCFHWYITDLGQAVVRQLEQS